jgi:DNA-binding response OmpR family regulator
MNTDASSRSAVVRTLMLPRPPRRIVLAEDDPEMRGLLADVLREDGHDVLLAETGLELIRAAQRAEDAGLPVDLVITDVRMPGWSGLEALDFLRRQGTRAPVIVMSAFGSARLHTAARALDATLVIDKPFDLDDLRAAVALLLASAGGPAPAPAPAAG